MAFEYPREVEFRLGRFVAYGFHKNNEEYHLDHAPTQQDFEAIAAALEKKDTSLEIKNIDATWGSCHGCGDTIDLHSAPSSDGEFYCRGCWNAPSED